jgi:hypothetical protein
MTKQFGQSSRTAQLVSSGLYNMVAGQYGQYPQAGPNYVGAGLELQQGRPGECGGPMGVLRQQATGSKPVSAAPVHFNASALAQAHSAAAGGPLPMQESHLGAQGHLNTLVKYGSPKFIWALVYSCTHWLRPRNSPPPPTFGYEGTIG